jgi:hypothetical protein
MELLVKIYGDKPSKIGVKYPQEYSAVKAYEAIFHKDAGTLFHLKMELVKERVNLLLISEQTGISIAYQALEYKVEQIKRLQAFIKPGMELEFVHIFPKANTLMIAKPFRKPDFIKLKNYEIVGPGYFVVS